MSVINTEKDSRDFFISRAGADQDFAKLIDGFVKKARKTTWLQDNDFGPASFMARMAEGFSNCSGMIALLSSSYQQSEHCKKEYEFVLADDPRNLQEKLIVFRIDDIKPIEHLKDIAYIDLVPVLNNVQAIERIVRVAIGVDQSPSEIDFAKIYRRAPSKILHPTIKHIPGLVEREDKLQAIDSMLRGKEQPGSAALTDQTNIASILRGMGGIGKTVLAKQYAWKNRDYFAGVWWIRSDTRQNMLDDLLALGNRLIPNIAHIQDEEVAVQTVLDEIASRWSQQQASVLPWLLIYDNAENPAEIDDLLPREGAAVLVTSRWSDWQGYANDIVVDVFSQEVAVEFLLEQSPGESKESAERLAETLGYLPLAIDQAQAYCRRSGCSFDDYWTRVSALIKKAPQNTRYERSVFATFDLAIEKVTDSTPEAEELVGILAFLAPDHVPRFLLAEELENRIDEAISALANYSLIKIDQQDTGETTINCHRLVQQVAESRLANNKEALVSRCLEMLIKQWPSGNQADEPKFWPICRSLLAHAQALFVHANQDHEYAGRKALLMNFVAGHIQSQGKYKEAGVLLRQCLEIDQRIFGDNHANTATNYNNMAANLDDQGKYEQAEPLYRKALEIRRHLLSDNHLSTAISYNNMAYNLHAQGKYQEAEPLFHRNLEIHQRLQGEDHPDTATGYNNIGYNLHAQDRYEEAEKFYLRGLEIRQHALDKDHPHIANSHSNLAANLDAQGKYQKAEHLHRQGLEIRQRVLGEEHPDTAISYSNLASNLDSQCRYEEAELLYIRGLEIQRLQLGEEHPATATSYNNIASNLCWQGRYEEAESMFHRGYETLLKVLGNQHPLTETVYQNWLNLKVRE